MNLQTAMATKGVNFSLAVSYARIASHFQQIHNGLAVGRSIV